MERGTAVSEAVIVDIVRTATGKRYGSLSGWHPVDLLAGTFEALAQWTGIDPAVIDDVIVGCVNQVGAQALNMGRSVVLAWLKEHPADPARVNPNSGAIALGHPLGASGDRIIATLLSELERSGGRYGLQAMREGGGMASATIIERLA
jgi:acetyl-CoA C-acetyltransferase